MCTISAAVSIASSVVGFMGQQDEYDARAQQWQQNRQNALAAGRDDQQAIQLRMIQEQEALTQQQHLTEIEGAEVAAEAEVSAANSGVSGVSLQNILKGIHQKVSMKRAANLENYKNTAIQLSAQMKATNTDIENRINSVAKPSAPNPLGLALTVAGQGLQGAADYKAAKATRTKATGKARPSVIGSM